MRNGECSHIHPFIPVEDNVALESSFLRMMLASHICNTEDGAPAKQAHRESPPSTPVVFLIGQKVEILFLGKRSVI